MKLLDTVAITLLLTQFSALAGSDSAAPIPFLLEYGVIVAHGDTVSIYNVPTTGSNSQTYDIECHLALNPDGTLYVGSAKVTPTPNLPPSVDQFLPGEYYCASNDVTLSVTGPTAAPGGRHVWGYSFVGNSPGAAYIRGGSWTTGPAQDNPQLLGIAPDSLFPKGYSFGRSAEGGDVIAAQQLGDRLIIGSLRCNTKDGSPTVYSMDNGYDVFRRKPASAAANP